MRHVGKLLLGALILAQSAMTPACDAQAATVGNVGTLTCTSSSAMAATRTVRLSCRFHPLSGADVTLSGSGKLADVVGGRRVLIWIVTAPARRFTPRMLAGPYTLDRRAGPSLRGGADRAVVLRSQAKDRHSASPVIARLSLAISGTRT